MKVLTERNIIHCLWTHKFHFYSIHGPTTGFVAFCTTLYCFVVYEARSDNPMIFEYYKSHFEVLIIFIFNQYIKKYFICQNLVYTITHSC